MNTLLMPLLKVDGINGALLLTHDGLPVASANLDEDEAETIGALATALMVQLRGAATRLAGGDLMGVELNCSDGTIAVRAIDELLLLLFQDTTVDDVTLDEILPDVQARCIDFAL